MTELSEQLLAHLQTCGVVLRADHGTLLVDAPHGVLTDELCLAIRTHKAALLAFVTPAPPSCVLARVTFGDPSLACAVCAGYDRYPQHGLNWTVWRCVVCWPPPQSVSGSSTDAS